MEQLAIIFAFVLVIYVVRLALNASKSEVKTNKKKIYKYEKKQRVMSQAEAELYEKLVSIIDQERCVVFPQMQLSTFLNHKVPGQNWTPALSRINSKSVDFLICNKETFAPVLAIELDDRTHDRGDRITRDEFVNAICNEAGVRLLRIRGRDEVQVEALRESISSML